MEDIYLLLGANLGDRETQLSEARRLIALEVGPVTGQSTLYESESWGGEGAQPDYLNQVVCVSSARPPDEVLRIVNRIEEQLGRVRTVKWGARVIDIDILFYGQELVDLPHLQIPHLHFQDRNFAMTPMNELASGFIHPRLGVSVRELLKQSTDPLRVSAFSKSNNKEK